MTWVGQVARVAWKDLLVEWRGKARLSGLFFFAMALLLLLAFAAGAMALDRLAGAGLWIGLLLASTRSLDQSFAIELEQGALEGLVLWPVDPSAIFYGKALANALVLVAVAFMLTPLTIALYDAPVLGDLGIFLALVVLGCTAIAAPGTLYALLAARARGASILLPVLLFPLVAPALMAAARGTALVMEGDPMRQAPSWLGLLAAFNLVHWSLSGLLFGRLLEEA